MMVTFVPQCSKHPHTPAVTWVQSRCLTSFLHLQQIAKCPVISIYNLLCWFPRMSVGKPAERVISLQDKFPPFTHTPPILLPLYDVNCLHTSMHSSQPAPCPLWPALAHLSQLTPHLLHTSVLPSQLSTHFLYTCWHPPQSATSFAHTLGHLHWPASLMHSPWPVPHLSHPVHPPWSVKCLLCIALKAWWWKCYGWGCYGLHTIIEIITNSSLYQRVVKSNVKRLKLIT